MEPISSLTDPLYNDVDEPAADDKPSYPRLFWLSAVVVVTLLILWIRLYQLQIAQGADYRDLADNNRFREVTIPAPRGVIYDRNQVVLARNRPSYTVGIVEADFPDPSQRATVLQKLADILGQPVSKVTATGSQSVLSQFAFVPIASNVPENVAFTIEERHLELPGVHVQLQPIRDYTLGAITSPILGYVGSISDAQYQRLQDDTIHRYAANDVLGQTGIERTYEAQLRGSPGLEQMEVDATGRQVRTLKVANPEPGTNLTLTIDAALQKRVWEILSSGIDRYHVASVVAIDPRNGQVLALAHLPAYDNNLFAAGISDSDYQAILNDPRHPLVNGAVSSAYPPGSIFDVMTAVAGLEKGVITPTKTIDCPGFITVPNRFDPTVGTRLVDRKAVGAQDVESAIANACDVFFYEVGGGDPNGKWVGVGTEALGRFAHLFGLGDVSGIDLAEEVGGLVPTVRWKRQAYNQEWVPMDTYQLAVGSGYLTATPLQLANVAATIANGGTLYRPQLILGTSDSSGVYTRTDPEAIRRVPVRPEFIDLVRRAMVDSMRSGQTESGAKFDGVSRLAAVHGWSGGGIASSVEFGSPDASGKLATHGWFVGFAPADHPTIAISVFLENGSGEVDAAGIAKDILTYYHANSQANH